MQTLSTSFTKGYQYIYDAAQTIQNRLGIDVKSSGLCCEVRGVFLQPVVVQLR